MRPLVACSVRDSKTEAYMTPMFFQSRAQAVRSFQDAVNEKGSDFNKHSEDFVLFVVGEFNPETGTLVGCAPESLGVGLHLVRES